MQLVNSTSIIIVMTAKGRLITYTLTKESKIKLQLDEQLAKGRITSYCTTGNSLLVTLIPDDPKSTENIFFISLRKEYTHGPVSLVTIPLI